MKTTDLKAMSFDELLELRDSVESLISKRAAAEKRSLEERLSRLSRLTGAAAPVKSTGRSLKGRKAAPKYRNPADPSETWAGRGMKPRWLQALIAAGRSPEEFAIGDAPAPRGRPPGKRAAAGKKVPGRKRGRKPAGASEAA